MRMGVALLMLAAAAAQQSSSSPPDDQPLEQKGIDLQWAVSIPLRDGVHLNATIYRPHGESKALPVIFTLTPYIGDSYHERAMYFAQHGYVFALIDVRGRGNSEGSFRPIEQEAADGHDVVEWLAKQPWCDGQVAMWGGSYAGYDQWATASTRPAHLATIVPAAAARPPWDFPGVKNIFTTYVMQWLTFTSGRTKNENLFGESQVWNAVDLRWFLSKSPFTALDRYAGNQSTVFQNWVEHPAFDEFWQRVSIPAQQIANVTIPVLTITGAYDGDQPGAMSFYQDHLRAPGSSGDRNYLIIGPWDHAGTRTPRKNIGGLDFGDGSLLDLNRLHREWYDWTMKSGSKPAFLKQHVAYYVLGPGANCWKYEEKLDGIAPERQTLYLASSGSAQSAFSSGGLVHQPPSSAPDVFVSDPNDMSAAEDFRRAPEGDFILSQRAVLELHGNGLIYHSDPFENDTEVAGFPELRLWLATDVPDTDISADLYAILPNGTSVDLSSDIIRARFRNSLEHEELLKPGAIELYDFKNFTWFARRLERGTRLRLVVSAVNSPAFEKNWNSAKPVAQQSGADAQVAHISLYHAGDHQSELILPIGDTHGACTTSNSW